jgi:hypothetical protein
MAKVIAPFLIKGTIDDINFVVTADGNNYARSKREGALTSLQFKTNPIFDRIREHGAEFGHCVKKSVVFRQLAAHFNNLAKDGSFAGRANKLLFDILQEDTINTQGKRTLSEGLKTSEGKATLLSFESNKLRPLRQVLKIKEQWHQENQTMILNNFLASEHLDWPAEATLVHLAIATANWDFNNGNYNTCYSETLVLDKESPKQTLRLSTTRPEGNNLQLTFIFIGFAKLERKKNKYLHRKNNTATLIAHHTPVIEQPVFKNQIS